VIRRSQIFCLLQTEGFWLMLVRKVLFCIYYQTPNFSKEHLYALKAVKALLKNNAKHTLRNKKLSVSITLQANQTKGVASI